MKILHKKTMLLYGIPALLLVSGVTAHAKINNEEPVKNLHSVQEVKETQVQEDEKQPVETAQVENTDKVSSPVQKTATAPQNTPQSNNNTYSNPELAFIYTTRGGNMPDVGDYSIDVAEYKQLLIGVGYQFSRLGNEGSIIIYSDNAGVVQSFDGTNYEVLISSGNVVTVPMSAGMVFIP